VAGLIVEWTHQEEAKYQAALLAAEVEAESGGKPPSSSGDNKKKTRDAKSPKPATRYHGPCKVN